MLTVISVVTSYLYYKGKFVNIKEKIKYYYQRWNTLNRLVASNKNNRFTYINSLRIIIISIYLNMLQKFKHNAVKIDKKTYELTYCLDDKTYKMLFKVKRGPNPILKILDENDLDVTSELLPYIGPNYDWHNFKISPKFFNKKTIKFIKQNEEILVFQDKDNMDLNI
tara:strand:+ start:234 stop:734 length:501 start_codon:yes stop_codon:yes gene_type:complete